jgi:DNA-directed RNA polymerase specialized sigma24 family protein
LGAPVGRIRRSLRERRGARQRGGGGVGGAGLDGEDVQPSTAPNSSPTEPKAPRPADLEARYTRLFQKLEGPAKGMVRRAFGSAFSDDELDDLYSSAWLSTLAAFKRKPRDLTDEELRRYLMTAVANQASREMRRRGRKPTLPIEVASGAADPTVAPDEAASQTEQARIARCSDRYRLAGER